MTTVQNSIGAREMAMSTDGGHPSLRRSSGSRRPARLTIEIVEGRGIWVELDGCLTDGSLDHLERRLARLGELGFEVVVVGARGIQELDGVGIRLLVGFVDRVCDGDGSVLIVDPGGRVRSIAGRLVRATITPVPPEGPWWLTCRARDRTSRPNTGERNV